VTGVPVGQLSRDSEQVDALIADRYIDSILAAHGRGADVGPVPADLRPDVAIRLIATRLARDLPRLHPSFRFEEALAAKLNDAALRMRRPLTEGTVPVALPVGTGDIAADVATVEASTLRPWADGRIEVGRPLLIGGAITSAAISLAGAAYVAWRIRRPQSSPMARAVRAVARGRLA
jgi:hypothetical protein